MNSTTVSVAFGLTSPLDTLLAISEMMFPIPASLLTGTKLRLVVGES